jgi:hypothetical protein
MKTHVISTCYLMLYVYRRFWLLPISVANLSQKPPTMTSLKDFSELEVALFTCLKLFYDSMITVI